MSKQNYNQDSVETLEFRDAIRERTEMYIGSRHNDGVMHVFYEILSNAGDEAINGFGDKINVTVEGTTIMVEDFGRGVPIGKRKDGSEALVAIYTVPHTGGKFDDSVYKSVGGLNGIGAKVACLTAEDFFVISMREGKRQMMVAHEGRVVSLETDKEESDRTGTIVSFTPSKEVFNLEPIKIDFEEIKEMCFRTSCIIPNVEYNLTNKDTGEKFTFKSKGIEDLLHRDVTSPLHDTLMRATVKEGTSELELVAQWAKGSEKSACFVNGLEMPLGGEPITGCRSAVTRTINRLLDVSLSGPMARKGINYIVSCRVEEPSFSNQTKTKIGNKELRSMGYQAMSDAIETFSITSPTEFKAVADRILLEQKAEEGAERAREAILNNKEAVKKKQSKVSFGDTKLVECRYHDENSRIVITEGDSAMGSVIGARNSDNTAIIGTGGKIINALKNPIERVLDDDVIRSIQAALGCGIGDDFDMDKLRYGHVGIMADADPDGFSIMCLILTFIHKYMPDLLSEGKVYWYRSPLFKVTTNSGKVHFAYDQESLEKLPKGDVQRLKGLGEMESEDLSATTFNEERDHLIKFTVEDAQVAEYYFNLLMGTEVEPRREFMMENLDFSKVIE